MRRGKRGVIELVEQPEFLFEQERAEHRLVRLGDFAEQRELTNRLLVGALQQRPARVLDPLAGLRARTVVSVPLVAAYLIDGALREPDHVERIEADAGERRVDAQAVVGQQRDQRGRPRPVGFGDGQQLSELLARERRSTTARRYGAHLRRSPLASLRATGVGNSCHRMWGDNHHPAQRLQLARDASRIRPSDR